MAGAATNPIGNVLKARVGVACVIHLIRRYRDTMFRKRLCGYRPQPEEPLQFRGRAENMEEIGSVSFRHL